MSEFRLVVLASGTGTNLQAIIDRLHGRDGIAVVGVGSDKREARALGRAREVEIVTAVFPREEFADRGARDEAMGDWIEGLEPDLVVLAGYMQILSAPFVGRFRGRIVNVHPALLPAFPGLDAIGQALAAGVDVTGVTVHYVDEGVDTGPPIARREVPVPASRDRGSSKTRYMRSSTSSIRRRYAPWRGTRIRSAPTTLRGSSIDERHHHGHQQRARRRRAPR